MKNKILNIINRLEKGDIDFKKAKQEVSELFPTKEIRRDIKPNEKDTDFFGEWSNVIRKMELK